MKEVILTNFNFSSLRPKKRINHVLDALTLPLSFSHHKNYSLPGSESNCPKCNASLCDEHYQWHLKMKNYYKKIVEIEKSA